MLPKKRSRPINRHFRKSANRRLRVPGLKSNLLCLERLRSKLFIALQ